MPALSARPVTRRTRAILRLGIALALMAAGPAGGQDSGGGTPEGLNFANGLFRQRRYDLAADEYERFLKDARPGPFAVEARYGLANARLFQGRYPDARRQFEQFLREAPDHPNAPSALFRAGETAYLVGDLPAAREAFERYTRQHPDGRHLDTAWPCLGDVYFRQGELDRAEAAYRTAIESHPEGRLADRARFGLGRALAGLKRVDEAVGVLKGLAASGGPDWSDKARLEAGRALLAAGRAAEADPVLRDLETETPRSPLVAEARLERAEALGRLGRREEAEALLGPLAADASQPLAPRAAHALGASLRERGKPAEALAVLDEVLKRAAETPAGPALWFGSAEAALALGRVDDARARLARAATPDGPWADDALYRAAGLALDAKDYPTARALAAELTTRYPDSPIRADARVVEARAALAAGEPKAAITLLERALADDAPSPRTAQAARYHLGLAYRADGQADKADKALEALAEAPGGGDALFLLGQGHVEAGRFDEAVGPLEKYLAENPGGEVADFALAHLAQARLALGEPEAAGEALDQLEARFPQSAALPATRLRLAEAALEAGRADRASALFRLAAGSADPALASRARAGLGWALLKADQPAEAAEAFETALSGDPDGPLAAETWLGRARALEAAGRADNALDAYKQALELHPRSPQAAPAALGRARLLADSGRPAEAAEAFGRYLGDHPDGAGEPVDLVLADRAWALVDAGRPDEADAVFAGLLEKHPDSPRAADARLKLAESAYKAGKPDEVEALLAPLAEAGAGATPAQVQAALYRLGRARAARRDWSGAASALDRLIDEHPDCPFRREARLWRAEVAFQAGDPRAAEAGFAALAAEPPGPNDPEGLVAAAGQRRIRSLVLLERWKDALAAADAWKAAFPGDALAAEVDYARGRALQGLARFDEARAAYRAAIAAARGGETAALAQFMIGETFFHQKNSTEALREYLRVDIQYDAPAWQAAALLQVGKVHEGLAQWAQAAETYEGLLSRFQDEPAAASSAAEAAERLAAARRRAGG